MSFARQDSVCHTARDLAVAPTEKEWRLARLRRPGMFGDQSIQQILNPGKYGFNRWARPLWQRISTWQADVAQQRAAHIRRPRLRRLENVFWHQSDVFNWTLYLPEESSVVSVPVETADDAALGYYNCRLIRPADAITLDHRSVVINFCYENEYFQHYVIDVLGGCSIEHHAFAHVDMPLDENSGHLLLGRIDPIDQALELTAFVVRPMQRIYIPSHTIHTNDYLLGTWETLLSSDCEFPSAKLKPSEEGLPNRTPHTRPVLVFCD